MSCLFLRVDLWMTQIILARVLALQIWLSGSPKWKSNNFIDMFFLKRPKELASCSTCSFLRETVTEKLKLYCSKAHFLSLVRPVYWQRRRIIGCNSLSEHVRKITWCHLCTALSSNPEYNYSLLIWSKAVWSKAIATISLIYMTWNSL